MMNLDSPTIIFTRYIWKPEGTGILFLFETVSGRTRVDRVCLVHLCILNFLNEWPYDSSLSGEREESVGNHLIPR